MTITLSPASDPVPFSVFDEMRTALTKNLQSRPSSIQISAGFLDVLRWSKHGAHVVFTLGQPPANVTISPNRRRKWQ